MALQVRAGDLNPDDEQAIAQVAALLVEGFKEYAPQAWPTMADALQEVRESFGAGRLSRIAGDEDGSILGWAGAIPQYDGHVWELHPLVIRPDRQGQGIGRMLVTDIEGCVRDRGGLTLWLGTDDLDGRTTLSGVDLYADICGHIAAMRSLRRHPFEFYRKLGFVVVGLIPDANGRGKPDILMAKQVSTGKDGT